MNNSFKQMTKDGTIKRADASRIQYVNIHVEPGFNLRDEQDPDYESDLQALEEHIARGGRVPALEVRPREEGGVWIIDGHRRHRVYGRLIEKGHPIDWVAIEQNSANDMQRIARVITSQEGRKLKPLEVAEGMRRMAAMGLPVEDIARLVGKTRQHVDQMLILANAPHAVHQLVAAGGVSATVAIDQVRKHGEGATAVLKDAKAKAGSGKVTAGAVKAWTPPSKIVGPLVASVNALALGINNTTREALLALEKSGGLKTGTVNITVPAGVLFDLLDHQFSIGEAEHKAVEKLRAKAGKAAQMGMGGA